MSTPQKQRKLTMGEGKLGQRSYLHICCGYPSNLFHATTGMFTHMWRAVLCLVGSNLKISVSLQSIPRRHECFVECCHCGCMEAVLGLPAFEAMRAASGRQRAENSQDFDNCVLGSGDATHFVSRLSEVTDRRQNRSSIVRTEHFAWGYMGGGRWVIVVWAVVLRQEFQVYQLACVLDCRAGDLQDGNTREKRERKSDMIDEGTRRVDSAPDGDAYMRVGQLEQRRVAEWAR